MTETETKDRARTCARCGATPTRRWWRWSDEDPNVVLDLCELHGAELAAEPGPPVEWGFATADVDKHADTVMADIADDIRTQEGLPGFEQPGGFKRIPDDVPDFSTLHDYRDANMYLLDNVPFDDPWIEGDETTREPHESAWAAYMDLLNAVADECDRRIRAGELARR